MLNGLKDRISRILKKGGKANKLKPSVKLLEECVKRYDAQLWYVYAYREFETRKHVYYAYEWIEKNIPKESAVLEAACGAGGMLYHLYNAGFRNLNGFDIDERAINAGRDIAQKCEMDIRFWVADAIQCNITDIYDVVVWVNGMYHIENYSLDRFFSTFSKLVKEGGYLIFDMVDTAYNKVPLNMYSTQDWQKEEPDRRPSEYKLRLGKDEIIEIGEKYNASLIQSYFIDDTIPRGVYIFVVH